MSLQEPISPTRERLNKGDQYQPPEISRSVNRPAGSFRHPFETLFSQGKIDYACKEAGMRLVHHYEGSKGADVRMTGLPFVKVDDGRVRRNKHADDFPTLRHGEEIRMARAHILTHNTKTAYATWMSVLGLAEGSMSLEAIGKQFNPDLNNAPQQRAAGVTVIKGVLDSLAVLWGFSQSYHSRNPPSR